MLDQKNNSIIKFLLSAILILWINSSLVFAQKNAGKTYIINQTVVNSNDLANPDHFYEEVIERIVFDEINRILRNRNLDEKTTDSLLQLASEDQASYMASIYDDELIQDNKKKETTADRLIYYGGSGKGEELAGKANIKKGKIPYSYGKIASDIVFKWFSSSKRSQIIEDIGNNLVGISAKLDDKAKRVYVSVVFGNYLSYNAGAKYRENLDIPYTTKSYGLKDKNPLYCNRIDRKDEVLNLQKNLTVEDNTIYFETDNIKELKRIVRKKKDAIAVDILQKEQFACGNINIVDHSQFNSGILTKRVYSNKLYRNNLADIENNPRAFKTPIAVLPDGIGNNYELNLVIIQNKSVCKSIPQNFLITPSGTYTKKIKLLADTVTVNSRFNYKPVADSMNLTFRIPFENKKTTYKTTDIEPFLKLLNEPAFVIYDLKITAYSSIEGTDSENKYLQQKRAESIVKALEGRQSNIINTEIITDYNWHDFERDIINTKHNILASMSLEEAQAYIRDYGLNKELEPILENHRYAQIDMKVTYDISGENEKPYVLKKFHNAIIEGNRALALSIQKYIMKQIETKRYKSSTITELNMPFEADYAGMYMNKYWVMYQTGQISDDEFKADVAKIHTLDPSNEYIAFNNLFLKITDNIGLDDFLNYQLEVDRLYYTPLKKETVDGLNLKLQFKMIAFADSVPAHAKLKEESINRIKQIVDIKEESLNNSLKLAELFIDNEDYLYAIKTLEPWIIRHSSEEKLYFTYISLCSRYEKHMHTRTFNYAMNRAREINPKRYCELLNGNYFSLKVFENNQVKSDYCKYCNSANNMAME